MLSNISCLSAPPGILRNDVPSRVACARRRQPGLKMARPTSQQEEQITQMLGEAYQQVLHLLRERIMEVTLWRDWDGEKQFTPLHSFIGAEYEANFVQTVFNPARSRFLHLALKPEVIWMFLNLCQKCRQLLSMERYVSTRHTNYDRHKWHGV